MSALGGNGNPVIFTFISNFELIKLCYVRILLSTGSVRIFQ